MKNRKQEKKSIEVWLCDLTHTQQTIASDSMPLGIGMIAAYGQKILGREFKFRLFKYPEELIKEFLKSPSQDISGVPSVIGFSNYMWNLDLSYSLAEEIKRRLPKVIVVFGGPNYPLDINEQKNFLAERKAIDFYIYGDGEKAFSDLLAALEEDNFDVKKTKKRSLKSCHYWSEKQFVRHEPAPRLSLKEIPSPYLAGLMDKFFDGKLMPLIQTCRGCPFTCLYCCEGQPYYKHISFSDLDLTNSEMQYIGKRSKKIKRMFIADSNFGLYKRDIDVCRAIARAQRKYKFPEYIHVATAKNNKKQVLEAAKIIGGSLRISASVQSTDAEVLKNINRQNVSLDDAIQLAKEATQIGGNTYAEIILALPGDSLKKYLKSVEDMINIRLNYLRIWTLMMFYGSELSLPTVRKKFGLITKFRVLPRCVGSYKFGRKRISSIEVEEVGVETNNMDFKDYLEARSFCLSVETFYNDGVLEELFFFLEQYNIKPFDLIRQIHQNKNNFPKNLKNLYGKFIKETADELSPTKGKLEKFAKNNKIVRGYISGKYGSNLVFKYKAISFARYVKEIHRVAFDAAQKLLEANGEASRDESILDFLNELKYYSLFKRNNMIDASKKYFKKFWFDIRTAEKMKFKIKPEDLKLKKPIRIKFGHTKEQARIIDDYLAEFGKSIIGISRIFSRIYIKKIYRQPLFKN
jgi:radical SAM superfamily enzyme YgiQ (UPF0313 family)